MVIVRGATLAGMAAAARLARLGHQVTLVTDGDPLGTRWAPTPGPGGQVVDQLPLTLTLPAAWRDLFKKSGSHLVTALNGAGLELVEAPPVEHRFPDGTTLLLPTDRGAQVRAVEATLGRPAALRWQALLDDLDGVWAALRRSAVEDTEDPSSRVQRAGLWLHRTIDDVADRLADERLAALVRGRARLAGTDASAAPALLLGHLVVERVFGRWLLTGTDGLVAPASRLIGLLADRLAERGVRLVDSAPGEAQLDCRPAARGTLLRPAPRAVVPPAISHGVTGEAGPVLTETHDHSTGLVVTWRRRTADGTLTTRHHHGAPGAPDLGWGLEPSSARAWLRRMPVVDGDLLRASACSPAGGEPWAELSSAALAAYLAHERLTGEDPRPTNKDFRPGRLSRGPTKRG